MSEARLADLRTRLQHEPRAHYLPTATPHGLILPKLARPPTHQQRGHSRHARASGGGGGGSGGGFGDGVNDDMVVMAEESLEFSTALEGGEFISLIGAMRCGG